MSRTMADHYTRWFTYERAAHAKAIASLGTVPADRRDAAEYRKAVDLLDHIASARHIWLQRLGHAPPSQWSLFRENAPLTEVETALADVHTRWAEYYAQLTDDELTHNFEYRAIDGKPFRNSVEDVLTQLHGHSLYHLGQIARLVRAAGGEPAKTDFIFWSREAL